MSRQMRHAWWASRHRPSFGPRSQPHRARLLSSRRVLALELLEERRPLSAEPLDLSLVDADYPLLRTSIHESQWLGAGQQYADASDSEVPPYPLGDTFKLHSNPTATKVAYLDFDGHITTGTSWNTLWNIPTINTPPYSFQGGSTFSDAELEQIQVIWERVAEDFLPFDIDVTTEDPGVDALRKLGANDTEWGIRVVIGEDQAATGSGGIAFIGSFNWENDTPTFVFNNSLIGVAEAASHEVGHTLGLRHDGASGSVEYYQGHGTGATGWAPIMGVGYSKLLVQWSKGQYPGANRTEDDLAIITTQNGFGYRNDDHGNTVATARELGVDPTKLEAKGIIERNTDLDYFVFATGNGPVTIDIDPFYRSPNLDILATLYDEDGEVVATSNPLAALDATFSLTLAAGTYYLSIDGTGKAAAGPDAGYPDYGSLGYYSITGTRTDPDVAGIHGQKWNDRDADGVRDDDEPGLEGWTIFIDEDGDLALDEGELSAETDEDGAYILFGLDPGTYVVAEVHKPGWAQTYPASPGTYTITVAMGEQAFNVDFGNRAGAIRGVKWFDRDSDGLRDDGEEGLANWTIFLDEDDDGELDEEEVSTLTDADGRYAFLDLPDGDYVVAEVQQGAWLQTFPADQGAHEVTLDVGEQRDGVNFGNAIAFIAGRKWNDRDGDGLQDADEPGLPGWRIYLDYNNNGAFDSGPQAFASTDAAKPIPDLSTITSTLTIAGLTAIQDLNVRLNILHTYAADLDVFLISPKGTRVELFTDVGSNGDNFANTTLDDEAATAIGSGSAPFAGAYRPESKLSKLDGEDPNGVWTLEVSDDGNIDVGTLLGWSITVTANEEFRITDEAGAYEFAELAPGTYRVAEVPQAGWVQTFPAAPGRHVLTLVAGQGVSNVNFGNRAASILGLKWNDRDGDAVRDDGEPGLPGWTIYLDKNGNGNFDNGANTTVAAGLPKAIPDLGKATSTLTVSGLTSIDDVDINVRINHTYVADLDVFLISPAGTRIELFSDVGGSGQDFQNTTLDDEADVSIAAAAGPFLGSFRPEGLLSAFDGENPNGTWTLELTDDAGNDVGSLLGWSLTISSHETFVVTGADGTFAFFDLPPGAYSVRHVPQANWVQTFPPAGGSYSMALIAGEQSASVNFASRSLVLQGDYDRDTDVDGHDFLLWQRQLGAPASPGGSGADGSGNGHVDASDLGVWQSNYGASGSPSVASAVAGGSNEDAAALAGPLAYARSGAVTRSARPLYRPVVANVTYRAAQITDALVGVGDKKNGVAASENENDAEDAAFEELGAALGAL